MPTRKRAGIVLEDAERSGSKEARYIAKVERPMPKRAPVMLRTVASTCWASVSWAEKTSSLSVRSKKAAGPPNRDHGLITRTIQHSKVDNKRARTRRVKKSEIRSKIWAIQSRSTRVWGGSGAPRWAKLKILSRRSRRNRHDQVAVRKPVINRPA